MTSYSEIIRGARPWQGVLDTSVMADDLLQRRPPARRCRQSRQLARGDDGARQRVELAGRSTSGGRAARRGSPLCTRPPGTAHPPRSSQNCSTGARFGLFGTPRDVPRSTWPPQHDRTPALRELLAPPRSPLTQRADPGARRATRRAHRRTHPWTGLRRRPAQSAAIPAGRDPARAARSAGVVSTTGQVRVPHRAATRRPSRSRAGAAWSKGPAKPTWSPQKARCSSIKDSSSQSAGSVLGAESLRATLDHSIAAQMRNEGDRP